MSTKTQLKWLMICSVIMALVSIGAYLYWLGLYFTALFLIQNHLHQKG